MPGIVGIAFFYSNHYQLMQPLTKIEMLRGFNRGDEKARNSVYDRYHDALLMLIRRITSDSSSADDLVNDTFEVLFEGNKNFEELSLLRDFLFQTARNICISHLQRQELTQRKYAEFQERRPYTDEDFYADISYSETRALIFKSIETLPDKLKTVFRLRYFEEMTNEDVARHLNISVKTAYNRFYEARQKLKWGLEKIQRFTLYLLNLLL
jgi:RNA polymerase sigma-70 factor (ECF subfamily)